ncbi:hypothetical protein [Massilia sp. NR 4-1]|uniref:hypothetical protein n=1 Tax=Massilia sp. NR 4-1 TaxID=1678028 RepID=UPI00067E2F0C|nr:hypothetical protein [Massilia sp. NR 4-1]AKU24003.1 XRE family transcriptional regulator [Massilia sp. NR 4-1]
MSSAIKHPGQAGMQTLSGTPANVRSQLNQVHAPYVVAVTLPDTTDSEASRLSELFSKVALLARQIMASRHEERLETLVEALLPDTVPTPNELKEVTMLAQARSAVLTSGDWMSAGDIAQAAGFSASNPSAQPNKWKRDGSIFALRHQGNDYFPSYGLGADHRPLKPLAKVLAVFGAAKDGWGLAYWFMSANSFLGGLRPQDLLASAPERVLAAAHDEMAAVAHG